MNNASNHTNDEGRQEWQEFVETEGAAGAVVDSYIAHELAACLSREQRIQLAQIDLKAAIVDIEESRGQLRDSVANLIGHALSQAGQYIEDQHSDRLIGLSERFVLSYGTAPDHSDVKGQWRDQNHDPINVHKLLISRADDLPEDVRSQFATCVLEALQHQRIDLHDLIQTGEPSSANASATEVILRSRQMDENRRMPTLDPMHGRLNSYHLGK